MNDSAVPLVINVAQGTTPSGIDINFAIKFNSGTTTTVSKTGLGTMALSGNASTSTYAFVVNAGRLMANGTSTGSGAITVNNTGTLAGTGTVGSTIVLNTGGKITGGNGTTGTLTIAGITFNPGSVIGGTITDGTVPSTGIPGSSTVGTLPAAASNTFLNKTGGTAIGLSDVNVFFDISATTFTLGSPYSYTIGQGFGDQSALNITDPSRFQWGFFPGLVTSPSLTGDTGGFLYLNFTPVVPEPSLLIGLGMLTALGIRRKLVRA
jgi:hypothetical protein